MYKTAKALRIGDLVYFIKDNKLQTHKIRSISLSDNDNIVINGTIGRHYENAVFSAERTTGFASYKYGRSGTLEIHTCPERAKTAYISYLRNRIDETIKEVQRHQNEITSISKGLYELNDKLSRLSSGEDINDFIK